MKWMLVVLVGGVSPVNTDLVFDKFTSSLADTAANPSTVTLENEARLLRPPSVRQNAVGYQVPSPRFRLRARPGPPDCPRRRSERNRGDGGLAAAA
jgi:hypothetical protein